MDALYIVFSLLVLNVNCNKFLKSLKVGHALGCGFLG